MGLLKPVPGTSGRYTVCPTSGIILPSGLWDISDSQYIVHNRFFHSPVSSDVFTWAVSPVEPKRRQATDGLSVSESESWTHVLIGSSTQIDPTNGTEYSARRSH